MQDVLIRANSDGLYDFVVDGNVFASAGGFETAIPVSLFTDARAPAALVPDPQYRRGWIGNLLTASTMRQLGSILWVLDQTRITRETLNVARLAAQDAFQWMIDDGIALGVLIDVTQAGTTGFLIHIQITDTSNVVSRYQTLWRATDASVIPNT
jgi:phage gp46-like protein